MLSITMDKPENMEPAIQPQDLNNFITIKSHGKFYGLCS